MDLAFSLIEKGLTKTVKANANKPNKNGPGGIDMHKIQKKIKRDT